MLIDAIRNFFTKRHPFRYVVFLLALFTALPTHAKNAKNSPQIPETLEQAINRIIASSGKKAEVGVVIQSMKTGQILYQKNAHQLLVPASSLKIFTAYSALQHLGPNFRFQTQMLTNAKNQQGGTLNGDLYVKFQGDPGLQVKDLDQMVTALNQRGIDTIKGRIIIDNTHYDNMAIAPGTVPTDKFYCYGAPVGAFILNGNCIGFRILPGQKPGDLARLNFPDNVSMPIKDSVVTKKTSDRHCHPILKNNGGQSYELTGCMRLGSGGVSISVPLTNANVYAENTIKMLLRRHQITVIGASFPTTHQPLALLASHDSKPLHLLIHEMLKKSDNLVANSVYKKLGASYFKQTGTWHNGSEAVREILKRQHNIDLTNMYMVDGSGLSRDNLVSPSHFAQLLYAAYHNPPIAPIFIDALPASGLNGTLKHRMGNRETIGKIKAKTGTMKGISSLVGYIDTRYHGTLAFTIMANNHPGTLSHYRFKVLENDICRFLCVNY